MKQGRILFTDLDGTLLSDDKSISPKNRRAVDQVLAEGNFIAISTGRPLESGKLVAEELGLTKPGCYLIAFNGSVLYDCFARKILHEETIPVSLVQRLFVQAKKSGIYIQTYDRKDILAEEYTKELAYYAERTRMSYRLLQNGASELYEKPYKALLISLSSRQRLEEFKRANAFWTDGKMNAFFSCPEYLEYCPCGAGKGSAVRRLLQILKIPAECAAAAGDEENDISMLQAVKNGAAVKNAAASVKEAAAYVTERDNNHDAVAEVIEKFFY